MLEHDLAVLARVIETGMKTLAKYPVTLEARGAAIQTGDHFDPAAPNAEYSPIVNAPMPVMPEVTRPAPGLRF